MKTKEPSQRNEELRLKQMSVRQEKKPRGRESWREEARQRNREEWFVGGDPEKLLFSEHGGLVRQHLAVGSKQQTLNQFFTACPNRLTHIHVDARKDIHTIETTNKQTMPDTL